MNGPNGSVDLVEFGAPGRPGELLQKIWRTSHSLCGYWMILDSLGTWASKLQAVLELLEGNASVSKADFSNKGDRSSSGSEVFLTIYLFCKRAVDPP